MSTHIKNRGFTLIELMIVVAVIGFLAAIAYPAFVQMLIRSDRSDGRLALLEIHMAQERFRATIIDGSPATYADNLTALGKPSTSERGLYSIPDPVLIDRGNYIATAIATAQGKQEKDATAVCRSMAIAVSLGGVQRGHLGSDNKFVESNECW